MHFEEVQLLRLFGFRVDVERWGGAFKGREDVGLLVPVSLLFGDGKLYELILVGVELVLV
jgi:hypothetical protein